MGPGNPHAHSLLWNDVAKQITVYFRSTICGASEVNIQDLIIIV